MKSRRYVNLDNMAPQTLNLFSPSPTRLNKYCRVSRVLLQPCLSRPISDLFLKHHSVPSTRLRAVPWGALMVHGMSHAALILPLCPACPFPSFPQAGTWDALMVRGVSLMVSVGGMLITALLMSLVSDAIGSKLDELRKGKAAVLESEHTVIIG